MNQTLAPCTHNNPERRRERGAALVETAFILPVLLLLIFGIFDAAFVLRDHLALNDITAHAGRAASIARDGQHADYEILQQIVGRNVGLDTDSIDRIVIYEATAPDADPTAGCQAGTSSIVEKCTVYSGSAFQQPATFFEYTPVTPGWNPEDRHALDLIGIWIEFDHQTLTGIAIDSFAMTRRIVVPIEMDL